MNRREFIRTLIALGASITLPLDINAATDTEVEAAWDNAGFAFDVQDYGTIWVAEFEEPVTRADAYGFSLGDLDIKYPRTLINFADSCPLGSRLQDVYEDYRYRLEDAAEEPSAAVGRDAKKRLSRLPYNPDTGWQIWLEAELEVAWSHLEPEIEKFLYEPPDSTEWEYLPDSANAQGAAYRYFRDYEDAEVLEKLGIEIIQGECPGSSYFAAELKTSVEEANRIAKELDLPYSFRPA